MAMEIRFVGMGMGWELLNERAMELWLEIIGMAVNEDGVGIEIVGLRLERPSPHLISDLVLFFEGKRRQERSTNQAATGIANRRDADRHHRLPVVPPPPTRLPHHPSGRSPCLLRCGPWATSLLNGARPSSALPCGPGHSHKATSR